MKIHLDSMIYQNWDAADSSHSKVKTGCQERGDLEELDCFPINKHNTCTTLLKLTIPRKCLRPLRPHNWRLERRRHCRPYSLVAVHGCVDRDATDLPQLCIVVSSGVRIRVTKLHSKLKALIRQLLANFLPQRTPAESPTRVRHTALVHVESGQTPTDSAPPEVGNQLVPVERLEVVARLRV
eukprot:scaffold74922_cov75-Phaeocystis_antarctica.AAC.4